ncbi:uncharacterized protein LOC134149794 [Rhea pennata]|uniref:uncharacterized protein LOC134149794 n=1 Tax=Rhea pennata TaxID=8795 RepID=UPI002E26ADCD
MWLRVSSKATYLSLSSFCFQSLSLLAPFLLKQPLLSSSLSITTLLWWAPMAEGFEHQLQDVPAKRCVIIEITNNLKLDTLRNPRSYCFSGHSHHPPPLQIPPGTVGKCIFVKQSYSLRGSAGLLVYDVGTSCLAIMFSNPFDYNLYCIEFGLKLLPISEELSNMEELFRNMIKCPQLEQTACFQKMKLSHYQSPLQVTKDNIRITATMSNAAKAILTILLEEKTSTEL